MIYPDSQTWKFPELNLIKKMVATLMAVVFNCTVFSRIVSLIITN